MKKLFSTAYSSAAANAWLLLLRIGTACFMLTHGYPKFVNLVSDKPIKFADPIGMGETTSFMLTIFAEMFCSIFLLIGFATRLSSFFLLFTMLVAGLKVHADDPFATKEKAFLYALLYLTLLVFGAGKYSVDNLIAGGKRRR